MKVNGKIIKQKEKVFILEWKGIVMKGNGYVISRMDMEQKNGLIISSFKAIMRRGKKMDRAILFGVMGINLLVTLKIIYYAEKVLIFGKMGK